MRHPLSAVIPPVQSQHNKQNKQVTASQPLKHHLLLPQSHFRPFPFHRLQTAQCLRPEETVHTLAKGIVILPLWFPQHSLEIPFPSLSFLRSSTSQISAGLRLSRPFLCVSLTKPMMYSVVFLPQVYQSHRSLGFHQILCTRIVTHIPKPSLSSCTILQSSLQNLC